MLHRDSMRAPVSSRCRSSTLATGLPSNATITSPSLSPPRSAGLFGSTEITNTPVVVFQLLRAHNGAGNLDGLAADTEVGAANSAVLNQLAGDELRRVDRHRETDSLGRQYHGGVDADDFTAGVDQRSAGVARIERGVGLNHVVDQSSRCRAQRAAERADHAGGDAVLKAIRIADGDRQLADTNFCRIAERDGVKILRRNPNDGEIGARIVADDTGAQNAGRR